MPTIRTSAILLLFLMLLSSNATAANFASTTSGGDWASGATWGNPGNNVEGSGYPGPNDNATLTICIEANRVTLSADQRVRNLTVQTVAGDTSSAGRVDTGTHKLDVYGTLDATADQSIAAPTIPLRGNYRFVGSNSRELKTARVKFSPTRIEIAVDPAAVLTAPVYLGNEIVITSGELDLPAAIESNGCNSVTVNGGRFSMQRGGTVQTLIVNGGVAEIHPVMVGSFPPTVDIQSLQSHGGMVEVYEFTSIDSLVASAGGHVKIFNQTMIDAPTATLAPTSVVEYCREGDQQVPFIGGAYGQVIFSGSGIKQVTQVNVSGQAIVKAGADVVLNAGDMTGTGEFVVEDGGKLSLQDATVAQAIQTASRSLSENATYAFAHNLPQTEELGLDGLPPAVAGLELGKLPRYSRFGLNQPLTVKNRLRISMATFDLKANLLTLGTTEQECVVENEQSGGAYGRIRMMISANVPGVRNLPLQSYGFVPPAVLDHGIRVDFKTASSTNGSITFEWKQGEAPGILNEQYAAGIHWVFEQEGLTNFIADIRVRNATSLWTPLGSKPVTREQARLGKYENGQWELRSDPPLENDWFVWPDLDHFATFSLMTADALTSGVEDWKER